MSSVSNNNYILETSHSSAASSSTALPQNLEELLPAVQLPLHNDDALHLLLIQTGVVDTEGNVTERFSQKPLLNIPSERFNILPKSLKSILSELKTIFHSSIGNFSLKGSGVFELLGAKYISDFLRSLNTAFEPTEKQIKEWNKKRDDLDISIYVPQTNDGVFNSIKLTMENSVRNYIKSIPINYEGNRGHFFSFEREGRLVEITFYSRTDSGAYLSTMAALEIPLEKYIIEKEFPQDIVPESVGITPIQAALDYILQKPSPHNLLNDAGWTRMAQLLISTQITRLSDWTKLSNYEFSAHKTLSDLLRHCEQSHHSQDSAGLLFSGLNALSLLRDKLSPNQAKDLWSELWQDYSKHTPKIDPFLGMINKFFETNSPDPKVLVAVCELCALVLEALIPKYGSAQSGRHVTSKQMLALKLIFQNEEGLSNAIQFKAQPIQSYTFLKSGSTEESALTNLVLNLINTEMEINPESSLRNYLNCYSFYPDQLTRFILDSKGTRPLFLQILDFYLLASMHSLREDRDIKSNLFQKIPGLLEKLPPSQGIALLKTTANLIGGSYQMKCSQGIDESLLKTHYSAQIADFFDNPSAIEESAFICRYQDYPKELLDTFLQMALQATAEDRTDLRMQIFRQFTSRKIPANDFYFTAFFQTVFHAQKNKQFALKLRQFGQLLLHFFKSELKNPVAKPRRLEMITKIIEALIETRDYSLADELLKAGDATGFKPLFEGRHGDLGKRLLSKIADFEFTTFFHPVFDAEKKGEFQPRVREFGELLLHFIGEGSKNTASQHHDVQLFPNIVDGLIDEKELSLAEEILNAGNTADFKHFFGNQHAILQHKLLLASELTPQMVSSIGSAITSRTLPLKDIEIYRAKINAFDKIDRGVQLEAISTFLKLLEFYEAKNLDTHVHQLFQSLLQRLDALFSGSEETAYYYNIEFFKNSKVQQLFPEISLKKMIDLTVRPLNDRNPIKPATIRSFLEHFLLKVLDDAPKELTPSLSAGIITRLEHTYSLSLPLTAGYKQTILKAVPAIMQATHKDFELQIRLLQHICLFPAFKLPGPLAPLFFDAIFHAFKAKFADLPTLTILHNQIKTLHSSTTAVPQNLIFLACGFCFENDKIDDGIFWICELEKGQNKHEQDCLEEFQNAFPYWLQLIHAKKHYQALLKLLPSAKKLGFSASSWEYLFTEELLANLNESTVQFLLDYPFQILLQDNPKRWKSIAEFIVSRGLGNDPSTKINKAVILSVLWDAKIDNSELWHKTYLQILQNSKLIDKAIDILQKATASTLLDGQFEHKRLCWTHLLSNSKLSQTQIFRILNNPQTLLHAFIDDQGALHESFFTLLFSVYKSLFSDPNVKNFPKLVEETILLHTRICKIVTDPKHDDCLQEIEKNLMPQITSTITPATFGLLAELMQNRIKTRGDDLRTNQSMRTQLAVLSLTTPCRPINAIWTKLKMLTIDFTKDIINRFHNEFWMIEFLSIVFNTVHDDFRREVHSCILAWINKLARREIFASDGAIDFYKRTEDLYGCLNNIIEQMGGIEPELVFEMIRHPQTLTLLNVDDLELEFFQIPLPTECEEDLQKQFISLMTECYRVSGLLGMSREFAFTFLITKTLGHLDRYKCSKWVVGKIIQIAKINARDPLGDKEASRNHFYALLPHILSLIYNVRESVERPILEVVSMILIEYITDDQNNGCQNINTLLTLIDMFVFEPYRFPETDAARELYFRVSMDILIALRKSQPKIIDPDFKMLYEKIFGFLLLTDQVTVFIPSSSSGTIYDTIESDVLEKIMIRLLGSPSAHSRNLFCYIFNMKYEVFYRKLDAAFLNIILESFLKKTEKAPFEVFNGKLVRRIFMESLTPYLCYILKLNTPQNQVLAKTMFDTIIRNVLRSCKVESVPLLHRFELIESMVLLLINMTEGNAFNESINEYLSYCFQILTPVQQAASGNLNFLVRLSKVSASLFDISIVNKRFLPFILANLLIDTQESIQLANATFSLLIHNIVFISSNQTISVTSRLDYVETMTQLLLITSEKGMFRDTPEQYLNFCDIILNPVHKLQFKLPSELIRLLRYTLTLFSQEKINSCLSVTPPFIFAYTNYLANYFDQPLRGHLFNIPPEKFAQALMDECEKYISLGDPNMLTLLTSLSREQTLYEQSKSRASSSSSRISKGKNRLQRK